MREYLDGASDGLSPIEGIWEVVGADYRLAILPGGATDGSPHLVARIDSLIAANWDQLTSAANLIIDVRGNPGGSNASYLPLQPLLYTGPVVTPGMSHRATDDNIQVLEGFLEAGGLTTELAGEIRALVRRMREHRGGFLDYGDVLPVETPDPAFRLHNPTARSNRIDQGVPLDNVGIDPDVRVPEEVLYWVDWVRRKLR